MVAEARAAHPDPGAGAGARWLRAPPCLTRVPDSGTRTGVRVFRFRRAPHRHPGTLGTVQDRLALLEKEYETTLIQLSDPAVISDQHRLREASRRHKEL